MLADGTGESTFLMAEKFAVYGSFGDASAVDGEVLACATQTVVMDEARDNLLAHTALAGDEHREVGFGHLQCCVQGMVQCLAVAHDAIALLHRL